MLFDLRAHPFLASIPGMGKVKAFDLICVFGSEEAIKHATNQELREVVSPAMATRIFTAARQNEAEPCYSAQTDTEIATVLNETQEEYAGVV